MPYRCCVQSSTAGSFAPHSASSPGAFATHRPGLDGLRGWAVIAVVAFHSGVLKAGWVGVDVFMALSGYLITGVLLRELASSDHVALRRFWLRRARRLIPGLAVLLVLVAIISQFPPNQWPVPTRSETFGALSYTSNWTRIAEKQSYWEIFANPSALDHLWSLAIEEQFYVIWPLIVLVAWRFGRRPGVLVGAGVLAVALGAWQMYLAGSEASIERLYVGTDTRAPAFLMGAALSALFFGRELAATTARWMLGCATVVIVAACLALDGQSLTTYQGQLLIVSLAGALAAAGAAHLDSLAIIDEAFVGHTIGLIGRWSYGVYLFHWPIVVLMQPYGGSAWARFPVVLGGSILAAALSYELFERHIREGDWQLRGLLGAVGVAAVAGVVILAVARQPLPEVDAATADALRAPLASVAPPEPAPPTTISADPSSVTSVPASVEPVPQRLLVVGDSVVYGIRERIISEAANRNMQVAVRAAPGCTMSALAEDQNNLFSTELCSGIRLRLADDVARYQPQQVVIFLGGTWDPFLWQGQAYDPCSAAGQAAIADAGDRYVTDLSSAGSRIILVVPPQMGGDYGAEAPGAAPCYAQAYAELQSRWTSSISLARADELICPVAAEQCLPDVGGEIVRRDGLHFTEAGARIVVDWMFEQTAIS